MKSADSPDYVVGVAGCGAMGQGIAQVSVQGGIRTVLFDAREGGAEAAKIAIAGRLNRLVEKGRMGEADAQAAIGFLVPATAMADLAQVDCVVEAVFEDLGVKHALFKELESVVRPDCILASNTSSIPLAQIARACEHRQRVVGLHFFNPVPLMKLVEVIRPIGVSDEVISNLMELGRRMTRTPVEVKDSPGFLVNMGGRAYTTEALRIVHEGIATPEQVDAIMRDCWGFRMGPFELMDLTGIDVNYPVSQIIYDGYNQDARLKTSPNHKAMYDAGLFGRKTGQGWYKYDEKGQKIDPPSPDFVTDAEPLREVSEHTSSPALASLIRELNLKTGKDGPVLCAPAGSDASTIRLGQSTSDVVLLDLAGDTSKRVTIMTPPGANRVSGEAVASALSASGRKVTWINDSHGFVGQRMIAMISNLGCYMAEIGLASPADIDTAMQLGLNYPRGSIELGNQLGGRRTLSVLETLHHETGDDRYRPTLWLKRRALLELSLHMPN